MAIPATVPADELFAGTGDAVESRSSSTSVAICLAATRVSGVVRRKWRVAGAEEQKTAIGS
jgi:hypothetical protein